MSFFAVSGKDQGLNIRHKVTELIDFIQDDDRLREERKKAKKNKDKYVGMSCDAMGFRGRASGGGGGGGGWGSSEGGWGSSGRNVTGGGFQVHFWAFRTSGLKCQNYILKCRTSQTV